jgi:hypothetical protein
MDPSKAFLAIARAKLGEEFAEAAFESFLDARHVVLAYRGAQNTEREAHKEKTLAQIKSERFFVPQPVRPTAAG